MSSGPYRAAVIDELSGGVSIQLARRVSGSYAVADSIDGSTHRPGYVETEPSATNNLGPLLRMSFDELAALEEAIAAFRGQRLEAATEATVLRESLQVERDRVDRLIDQTVGQ